MIYVWKLILIGNQIILERMIDLDNRSAMTDEILKFWLIEVNTNPSIEVWLNLLKMLAPRIFDYGFGHTILRNAINSFHFSSIFQDGKTKVKVNSYEVEYYM
ncbi:unnamed protein product [Paramecium octaurelia]|uniref:Uncharacterized protein n=1 Tax=Paramecium octaurelia TaxID=43137 RepID=A0A8S1SRZ4_PAROT|nr:unnamed protein product [Paramecium octaurelia]